MSSINKIRKDGVDYDINSDSLPIGTIVEYEGDTIPDGYEEVTEEILSASGTHTGFTAWNSVTLASITLSKGKYIVQGKYSSEDVTNTSANIEILPNVIRQYYNGNNNFSLYDNCFGLLELQNDTEIKLTIMLNNDNSGSITGTIQAIKISD